MPAVSEIAKTGISYNQFHTTALCSPTRASLLTGRNHHSVHMGGIAEVANSFPGYDSVIPAESATVAKNIERAWLLNELLREMASYATWEKGPTGPFDRWPTGMGFDRFYGILGGEASQWEPAAYDKLLPLNLI